MSQIRSPKVIRNRHERLMDALIVVRKTANGCDKYTTNRLLEGIDYLYSEVDILIYQVEELKKKIRRKK